MAGRAAARMSLALGFQEKVVIQGGYSAQV
jgi:hypothetical protein